jgi:DNA-binding transcriptional LysR family regulator
MSEPDGGRHALSCAGGARDVERSATDIGELQDEPRGTVRITAPPDLAYDYLSEPIASFAKRHPKVSIELVLTTKTVDLIADGIDFALRAGKLRDSPLIVRRIANSPLIPLAAKSYVSRRGLPREPEQLTEHDCILFRPENGRSRWTLKGPRDKRTISITNPITTDDMRFVGQLLHAGVGIGLVPLANCPNAGRGGWCACCRLTGPSGALHLVHPPARHVPQRVALLREHLFEHLQKALAERDLGGAAR